MSQELTRSKIKLKLPVNDFFHPGYGDGFICGERVSPITVTIQFKGLQVEYPECLFPALRIIKIFIDPYER